MLLLYQHLCCFRGRVHSDDMRKYEKTALYHSARTTAFTKGLDCQTLDELSDIVEDARIHICLGSFIPGIRHPCSMSRKPFKGRERRSVFRRESSGKIDCHSLCLIGPKSRVTRGDQGNQPHVLCRSGPDSLQRHCSIRAGMKLKIFNCPIPGTA